MLAFVLKLFRRSDGVVVATFPDVPAAVAWGRDDGEAFSNAAEALKRALRRYVEAGFEIPLPRAKGVLIVEVEEPSVPAFA